MNGEMSVKERVKSLDFQKAKNIYADYEYCLIYKISEVILDQTARVSEIDWKEVQEAWFFGEQGQLHIYREDDLLSAVLIDDAELSDAHTLEKAYRLMDKFRKVTGKEMLVAKEYMDFDKDGQAYVAYTRLLRLADMEEAND